MSVVERARKTVRLPRKARREQLLASAQQVFVSNGYHAAAMDEIAENAGVSKPVLYQHFPSKLDLYLALLEQSSEDLIKRVQAALDGTHDNHLRVRAAIEAYFAFVDDESAAFRLVFESDLTNEPAVRDIVEGADVRCADSDQPRDRGRHRPSRGPVHAGRHGTDRHGTNRCPLLVAREGRNSARPGFEDHERAGLARCLRLPEDGPEGLIRPARTARITRHFVT
ncbi:MAG: TetR/AcrR family transcriptional regulator [Candidatus Nanopelagicales bacterium]